MITPVLEKDHSGGKEGTDGEGTTLEAGKALITTAIVRAISTMASLDVVGTTGILNTKWPSNVHLTSFLFLAGAGQGWGGG